ncbi:Abi family protein [Caniella muris]|uniref:Abi family protein n=1 Tax=Caniella muris TaxID=2941502 RepID=UPI0020418600|nr:Abi family protein [Caniella muris]
METPHPFCSIEEQVSRLTSRGMTVSDRRAAENFLITHNYYRVVNGYKFLFLDKDRSKPGNEVFREGSDFDQLVAVFMFDRELRSRCLFALEVAESRMKTATVHAFCDRHRGTLDYLSFSSYCSKDQYRAPRRYDANLSDLLTMLKSASLGNCHHKAYVGHYLEHYDDVPLWVLSGCLSFGNMAHFYDLCDVPTRNEACKLVGRVVGRRIESKRMSFTYKVLRDYRNICAHGDRLFCARTGRRDSYRFKDFIDRIETVLTATEFEDLVLAPVSETIATLDMFPYVKEKVVGEMGIEGLVVIGE